ncbi:MAG TPA: DegT/DnrJ/EryC1/StrS family aminotransferase [bacterium]|jgi:dTDP-4-amino-4,6-dideoxygalactose transaminase|nr:DegT/DnrJ/EryC1/StrS family aminotransferase [bacterium]
MTIPVSKPSTGALEAGAVAEVLSSGWLGFGKQVLNFEERLRSLFDGRETVAVSSGTAALHLALESAGITAGAEVIVPSLTFCATIQAIRAAGATPVFCEVEPETLNLDVGDVARKVTARTRAIVPVHYCGIPADMDRLLELSERHGTVLVEDAAHAFGSTHRGRRIGSFGQITCFSFDPIKNITCGEGGAIVTSDPAVAALARKKRVLGISRDRWQRMGAQDEWRYQVETVGWRYHMSNISAAIGLVQLDRMEQFKARKLEILARYNQAFRPLTGLRLLKWPIDDVFPFTYVVRVLRGRRAGLMAWLRERGVDSGVNYIPNHLQPQFAPYSIPLPVTEGLYEEILSLPFYADLKAEDQERVIQAVNEFFK